MRNSVWLVTRKVPLYPRPLCKLLPFVAMSVMGWSWVLGCPELFVGHSRVFCFALGFLFCQMVCSLMVAHICDEDFRAPRKALLPLLAAWTNGLVGPIALPNVFPIIDDDIALYALLAANFAIWLHFVWNASQSHTRTHRLTS